MKLSKALASIAAATSLIAAPVAAQASTAELRTATEVEGENLAGGFLIPAIAILAIILGIVAVTGGDDEAPTSP